MTLEEAIKHAEEVAEEKENEAQDLEYSKLDWKYEANQCSKCSEEHRQLAKWLKELKNYRERIPSYEAGYNDAKREIALSGEYERCYERGKADAQPKMGHWIDEGFYADGHSEHAYRCSECDEHYIGYVGEYKYCPTCGSYNGDGKNDT